MRNSLEHNYSQAEGRCIRSDCGRIGNSPKEPDMKRTALFAGLIVLIALIIPASGLGQDKLDIHAKIWKYEAICDFADPPNSSGYSIKATNDKVTLEVTDCKTFEKKHVRPAAVCVTLKNNSPSAMDVPIDKDLSSVEIATKESAAIAAIAKRFLVEGPMGGKKMEYVTRAEASYLIKLDPGQEINIVYLFPKAEAGDTIKVSKLKPTKIE
jgi:hypothetical protein